MANQPTYLSAGDLRQPPSDDLSRLAGLQPAFSPDGSAIAFVWRKEGEQHGHIYVKQARLRSTCGSHLGRIR